MSDMPVVSMRAALIAILVLLTPWSLWLGGGEETDPAVIHPAIDFIGLAMVDMTLLLQWAVFVIVQMLRRRLSVRWVVGLPVVLADLWWVHQMPGNYLEHMQCVCP